MKIIKNIFLILYALIAVIATIFLISINQYRVTELGEYSFIYIDKHTNTDTFAKGDLAIVSSDFEIEIGDEIFFYNAYEKNIHPTVAKVLAQEEINVKETTYSLDNDKSLSSEFVIGKVEDSSRIPYVGYAMKVIESKWGFLFLIVLPVLIAFIYELYSVFVEVSLNKRERERENLELERLKQQNSDENKS